MSAVFFLCCCLACSPSTPELPESHLATEEITLRRIRYGRLESYIHTPEPTQTQSVTEGHILWFTDFPNPEQIHTCTPLQANNIIFATTLSQQDKLQEYISHQFSHIHFTTHHCPTP